jgi:broad specificity phosphatase PhoE
MKLIIVRHGQTEWNKEEIFRGRADIPLDEIGLKQANAVAENLCHLNIKTIYSSPLKRALAMAQAIGKKVRLKPIIENDFIDFDFGQWQGLTLAQVRKEVPSLYRQWLKNPGKVIIPGGENLSLVRERVAHALSKVLDKQVNGDIVIVTHRIINKILLCIIFSLNNSYFWKIKQDVGSINIVDYTEGFASIVSLNDTCHIKHLMRNNELKDF